MKNIKVLKQFHRILTKYRKTYGSEEYINVNDLLKVVSDLIGIEKSKIEKIDNKKIYDEINQKDPVEPEVFDHPKITWRHTETTSSREYSDYDASLKNPDFPRSGWKKYLEGVVNKVLFS